jgi:hypothetical protein
MASLPRQQPDNQPAFPGLAASTRSRWQLALEKNALHKPKMDLVSVTKLAAMTQASSNPKYIATDPIPFDQVDPENQFDWEVDAQGALSEGGARFELIPYLEQGDEEMTSNIALVARQCLRRHPLVTAALDKFWCVYQKDQTGHIQFQEYMNVHKKMSKATTPPSQWTEAWAEQLALRDWHRDTASSSLGLNFERCGDSFFELADLWAESIDPQAYADFLKKLYSRIVKTVSNSEAAHWRDLNLVRALEMEGAREDDEDPFYSYSSDSSHDKSFESASDIDDEEIDQELKAARIKEVSDALSRKMEAKANALAQEKKNIINLRQFEKMKNKRSDREPKELYWKRPTKNRPWSASLTSYQLMTVEISQTIRTLHGLDNLEQRIATIRKSNVVKRPIVVTKASKTASEKEKVEKNSSNKKVLFTCPSVCSTIIVGDLQSLVCVG